MANYKNNVFEVLSHIDNNDYGYFDNLTDEQKNELQPYTLLRWLSVTNSTEEINEYYALAYNLIANNHFFELATNKELMIKLLCAIGYGKGVKHKWMPLVKVTNDKFKNKVRQFYQSLTDDEFELLYNSWTKDDKKEIEQNLFE